MNQPDHVLDRCFDTQPPRRAARRLPAGRTCRAGVSRRRGPLAVHRARAAEPEELDGAREALETASLLVPLDPASQCALAECYARGGRRELARDLYRDLARNGRSPTALLPAVASGLGTVGDDETALQVCRELARRELSGHEVLFGTAYYMRRLAYPAESVIPVVRRAHNSHPGPPSIACCLTCRGRGDYDEAADVIRGIPPESVHCRCCPPDDGHPPWPGDTPPAKAATEHP